MEKRLHLLETFNARGSDGQVYRVHGYEHLARLDVVPGAQEDWESTGLVEYKLADGRRIDVAQDGTLRVPDTGVQLRREA